MNLNQLQQGLEQAFYTEQHRIVFWYDAEQSFTEEIKALELNDVQILNMAEESSLAIKLKLELEDQQGKYLLYFPSAEPETEKDWLLDIKLYSRSFYADRFSIIFNELGLQQQSLREHLAKREEFLKAKARLSTLKRYIQPDADEQNLDMAMIAAVVKADSAELMHIVLALADEMVQQNLALEVNPESFAELEKFQLVPALVTALQAEIGYPASVEELNGEAPFKLGTFFIRLMSTGFCESLGDIPLWAQELVMSSVSSRATARAFLSRWRDSSKYYPTFDQLSQSVANALRIQEKIGTFDVEQLLDVMTFEVIEQKIIVDLASTIPAATKPELEHHKNIISARLDGYWASKHKDDVTRRRYRTVYTALQAAIDLFSLRQQFESGFHFESSEALYKAYEQELYRFDMAYRHYGAASQRAHVEILKKLDEEVENCYSYWFIDHLAQNWGDRIEAEQRLKVWKIADIPNQQNFYYTHVRPLQNAATKRRVVVIISDALRYEAALELRDRINEKRYSEATLSSQLGVVPSYTTLGMASLLPHQTLEYKEAAGDDVFVDGQSSKGTTARSKILAAYNGMAVTAETVKSWSRDEGREALKDQELIYVYHNVIDARGDSASTESETFMAVEHAIEELTELSRKFLLNFNTSTLFITADHGFLFQQSKLEAADRSSLTEKTGGDVLKSKKRYVIGQGLTETKEAWKGSTKATAGTISETDFWIPKGANRFHFVGGSRFVHGGVMPQEIVVPVLTVKQLRGEKAEQRTKRKVSVISAKSTLKMVNNIQKFDLLQTEPVTDQVLAVTLSIAIYDGDVKVSSEETLTFDSTTDSVADRVKQVRLSLSGTDFDRKKDYFLILKDKDLNVEMERYKVTIDLAFTDDFF
ncbi:BREX-1 system phosphatase PglZ type A [Acinetobacter johnsonii]|uniref:BREX-1 system phosphatase PglZ type A n=2 Tax=Gammaproteobacteria TaxID=1236 RepID=UPI00191A9402|nr:BREX-1 system phosphatase PglZ type A [Acinetobacter johnsonii]QQT94936.1 BREX-1 system phosphatase PglZ type A [Acinetobacter johnsonii]